MGLYPLILVISEGKSLEQRPNTSATSLAVKEYCQYRSIS